MVNSRSRVPAEPNVIEMHLRAISQLLDSLDPSPFHRRDLNPSAEEYIVDSAKELPSRTSFMLVVNLDQSIGLPDEGRVVGDAIRTHFARRSHFLRRDLRQLIRRGLISLCIGMTFLVTLFIIAQAIGRMIGETGFFSLLRESMLIVGWVAMWRPLEIFLYDWWPIVSEWRLHDRLSRINVRVVYRDSENNR
jgi:hypothetical protein